MKYFLLTNDVETTSIVRNGLFEDMGERVLSEGLPPLLDLLDIYRIKSTFFFTGDIARLYPGTVRMVAAGGHEVASHGLVHDPASAFDVLPFDLQVEHLRESKKILEDIAGQEVISFRAPSLRVNRDTPRALAETGFLIDSSIASQRMDMMFSFGTARKLHWFTSPRRAYRSHPDELARKGNGSIIEIPVSAMGIPYIGTTLRIIPGTTRLVRNMLKLETSLSQSKPIVFLFHPTEIITENTELTPERRGKNFISYLIADRLRRWLKLKNLGPKALELLEKEMASFSRYQCVTLREYARQTGLMHDRS